MTPALQIALFLASVAIVIFVTYAVIALEQLRKHAEHSMKALDEMKVDVKVFVQDIHQAGQTINDLSAQAQQQMEEVGEIVQTARGWCERADRIVKQIDEAIEPPLATLVRNVNIYRKGVGAFLQFFAHRRETNSKRKEIRHE